MLNLAYKHGMFGYTVETLHEEVPWTRRTDTRLEAFMAHQTLTYTYGSGNGVRSYESVPFTPTVLDAMDKVNWWLSGSISAPMNVCFLNLYLDQRDHLGWHADDSPGTDHDAPIVVASFGATREIWWRAKGETGTVPLNQRQPLASGSIFVMPPGMQRTHQHRIPKADRPVGVRISMTFRHFVPTETP